MRFLERFRKDPVEEVVDDVELPFRWLRPVGRVIAGITGLALVTTGPELLAVAALLGIPAAVLIHLLRKRKDTKLLPPPVTGSVERRMALMRRLDETHLWTRTASQAVLLSFIVYVFGMTAAGFLEAIGLVAALPWIAATVFTSIPVAWLGVETLRHLKEWWQLRKEPEDDREDPIGPAFSFR